jgi:hypothetical protein
MKRNPAWLMAGLVVFGSFTSALGANLAEKVKVDTEGAGLRAKAEFDLEFATVTGPRIQQVKKHEIRAVDAPAAH